MNKVKPKTPARDRVSQDGKSLLQPNTGRGRAVTLPRNCFVVQMTVFDPPQPIKSHPKIRK